jgi:hypothetical protein
MKRLACSTVVLVAVVLAACDPVAIVTFDARQVPLDPQTQVITPQGGDAYTFTSAAGELVVDAAPDDVGHNLRAIFWPAGAPEVTDAMTCATWADESDSLVQQGAALRIVHAADGIRAVTVTKNIYFGVNWAFNFHLWASAPDATTRLRIGSVDLGRYLRLPVDAVRPLPWHFCARVIGPLLQFKVWVDGDLEPRWGDRVHGGATLLPPGFRGPGIAGWYVGHLPPDARARFTDLRAFRLVTGRGPTSTTQAPTSPTANVTAPVVPGMTATVAPGSVTITGERFTRG